MNLVEFAKEWTDKNIPESKIYGTGLRDRVYKLARFFANQGHSGASAIGAIRYFVRLMDDYDKNPNAP